MTASQPVAELESEAIPRRAAVLHGLDIQLSKRGRKAVVTAAAVAAAVVAAEVAAAAAAAAAAAEAHGCSATTERGPTSSL